MFSVIISEKGGAERREAFDRAEINIGRVQGNDLVLPKGNVSKRHARVLFRDGRFIVTDLKSTNGTYVNGRKIPQATIVREGDKIYIGDFVLRIEAAGGLSQSAVSSPAPPFDDVSSDLSSSPPGPPPPPPAPPAGSAAAAPSRALDAAGPRTADPDSRGPLEGAAGAPRSIPEGAAAPRAPAPIAPDPGFAPRVAGAPPGLAPAPTPVVLPGAPRALAIMPPPGAPSSVIEPPSSSQPSSAAEKALRPPSPRIEALQDAAAAASKSRISDPKTGDRHEVISHFPLEQDPDESVHVAVPAAPRVPSPRPVGGKTLPVPGAQAIPGGSAHPPGPAPAAPRGAPIPPTAPGTPFTMPQPAAAPHAVAMGAPPPIPVVPTVPAISAPAAQGPGALDRATSPSVGLAALGIPAAGSGRRATYDGGMESAGRARGEPSRAAAHRTALIGLVDRVGELCDLHPLAGGAPPGDVLLAGIERALAEASAPLRGQGEIDVEALVADARRELCELGPLTPLFEDEDVTEIQIVRHDHVVAMHGRRQVASETGFTSEQAVSRVIRRLCVEAGKPLGEGDVFVERRLTRGVRMFAVLPRAEDHGHMVVLRKPQRADLGLEDLVRSGTISRAMAGLFTQCVAAHANILVTGAVGAGTTTLIGALAAAGSTEDRVVVLQEDDELIFNQPHTISILLGDTPEEGARAVQAAARVRPDRLVVGAFAGAAAAELVDAMGDGVDGVLAGARAPTLRQAVLRLTADLAATKPGISPEVAREWLASVFDLAIEVARLRDGRHRVLRVAELGVEGNRVAIRDIFTFTVERMAAGGAIEGSFAPTGVVPGILEDLAARGVPVDPGIFRRHARPDSGDGASR